MASQNTVSRDKLTRADRQIFSVCADIIDLLSKVIPDPTARRDFQREYGRLHESRDAGQGRGAGKLQRDALTTRGRQMKAPFSNRNLRWHPLVAADSCGPEFKEVDKVTIGRGKQLNFYIHGKIYKPSDVYKLSDPYCVPNGKWAPIAGNLRAWSLDDWIKNWCTIPAAEYSSGKDAIETFAVLGLSVAVNFFGADLKETYKILHSFLKKFQISSSFPPCSDRLLVCPLCLTRLSQYPAGLAPRKRPKTWTPSWQTSKRGEGDDESIQLTHVYPLQEGKALHTAEYVRYGHRWCNVAMTDHSVPQTLDFAEAILKKQGRI